MSLGPARRHSSWCDTTCVEVAYRKSSRSDYNGNCVEVALRKSSYSSDSADCVEAGSCDCGILVRDSKDPDGPVLTFGPHVWREFIDSIKEEEL